jgi:hypothetical protein
MWKDVVVAYLSKENKDIYDKPLDNWSPAENQTIISELTRLLPANIHCNLTQVQRARIIYEPGRRLQTVWARATAPAHWTFISSYQLVWGHHSVQVRGSLARVICLLPAIKYYNLVNLRKLRQCYSIEDSPHVGVVNGLTWSFITTSCFQTLPFLKRCSGSEIYGAQSTLKQHCAMKQDITVNLSLHLSHLHRKAWLHYTLLNLGVTGVW